MIWPPWNFSRPDRLPRRNLLPIDRKRREDRIGDRGMQVPAHETVLVVLERQLREPNHLDGGLARFALPVAQRHKLVPVVYRGELFRTFACHNAAPDQKAGDVGAAAGRKPEHDAGRLFKQRLFDRLGERPPPPAGRRDGKTGRCGGDEVATCRHHRSLGAALACCWRMIESGPRPRTGVYTSSIIDLLRLQGRTAFHSFSPREVGPARLRH